VKIRNSLRLGVGRVFAALCLFSFAAIAGAEAPARWETLPNATSTEGVTPSDGVARVLTINGPNWPGLTLQITAAEPSTVAASNCNLAFATYDLPENGAVSIEEFTRAGGNVCGALAELADGTQIGVVQLPVTAGRASFATEAIFRDARGVLNVVDVPSLPQPLSENAWYTFSRIENDSAGKTTYIAVIADQASAPATAARVTLSIRDDLNQEVDVERFDVDGFALYALKKKIRIGSIRMTTTPRLVGPVFDSARVYAVALVGFAEGGSPRVVVPALSVAP
jgi:hypothetical protein